MKSNQVRKLNFFTTYNSSLPNIDSLVKKYHFYIVTKTIRNYFLPVLLIPYIDVTKISKNYCLHRSFLTRKVLKAIASLVVILATSATIMVFTCLIVQ